MDHLINWYLVCQLLIKGTQFSDDITTKFENGRGILIIHMVRSQYLILAFCDRVPLFINAGIISVLIYTGFLRCGIMIFFKTKQLW